jgi:hypothetical protein
MGSSGLLVLFSYRLFGPRYGLDFSVCLDTLEHYNSRSCTPHLHTTEESIAAVGCDVDMY